LDIIIFQPLGYQSNQFKFNMNNKIVYIGLTLLCSIVIIRATPGLAFSGKATLLIFTGAIMTWSFTKTDATLVAVVAAFLMSALGLTGGKMPLSGLGDSFIVFVVGGFMLGGAYRATGLSEKIAGWFAQRSTNVSSLFYLLTAALVLLSFVVPSTSARASMLMPVYLAIAAATDSANVRKALAILFPTIIVLSCVISFMGAGANLMTADFIEKFSGEKISYSQWMWLGAPFGTTSCFFSTWIILQLFLTREERSLCFDLAATATQNDDKNNNIIRLKVIGTTIGMIALWMTEPWHGIDAALIMFGGVLLLCMPTTGVLPFKTALKEVEWSLVVFMAATIELSQGLVQSGAVAYLTGAFSASTSWLSGTAVLLAILIVALMSHLLIHSRTARAAVLMPVLIPIGISAGYSGLLVAFFANAAMGYCLTLPVCAKPVALFSTTDDGYDTKDLVRLSLWLVPVHLILLWGFCWVYG
jgi:solute carrier family 13 (sodium-dependent dicarboxylate transporter), member 2/3/5